MRTAGRARLAAAGFTVPVAGFTVATAHQGYAVASATFSAPVPATINTGDLILFQYVTNSTVADTITPPASVTELPLIGSSVVGGNGYAWFWHLVTAAEAATPPATWDFALSTARTGNIMTTRVTGHNLVTTFDTAVGKVAAAASAYAVSSLTTTVANTLLIGGANLQSATNQSCAADGSWTQDDTTCGLTLGRGQIAVHQAGGAAGVKGGWTWTQTAALAGEAFVIAVRPA